MHCTADVTLRGSSKYFGVSSIFRHVLLVYCRILVSDDCFVVGCTIGLGCIHSREGSFREHFSAKCLILSSWVGYFLEGWFLNCAILCAVISQWCCRLTERVSWHCLISRVLCRADRRRFLLSLSNQIANCRLNDHCYLMVWVVLVLIRRLCYFFLSYSFSLQEYVFSPWWTMSSSLLTVSFANFFPLSVFQGPHTWLSFL